MNEERATDHVLRMADQLYELKRELKDIKRELKDIKEDVRNYVIGSMMVMVTVQAIILAILLIEYGYL